MANLIPLAEIAQWVEQIHQRPPGEPLTGGAPDLANDEGFANVQAQQLANRTAWLRAALAGIGGQVEAIADLDAHATTGLRSYADGATGSPEPAAAGLLLHIEGDGMAMQEATSASGHTYRRVRAGAWGDWLANIDAEGGSIDGALTIDGTLTMNIVNHALVFGGDGAANRTAAKWTVNGADDWNLNYGINGDIDLRQVAAPANPGASLLLNGAPVWANSNISAQVAQDGYMILPNGLIVQWGRGSVDEADDDGKFEAWPIAFPNDCFACSATAVTSGGVNTMEMLGINLVQPNGRRIVALRHDGQFATTQYHFWAIGH